MTWRLIAAWKNSNCCVARAERRQERRVNDPHYEKRVKILLTGLTLLILILQYQLWLGEDGLRELRLLQADLDSQRAENAELAARNRALQIEVIDLKNGLEAVEERARSELGMIGEDETFYLIIE